MSVQIKKPEIAVVGAGLAGLATAYELAKAGMRVTVFEAEARVGGRVKSVLVNKQAVDLGGFIIYPWYTQYHRLIQELGLVNQLQPIGKVNVVYQSADGSLFNSTRSIALLEKLKLGKGLFQAWRKQRPNFRAPDLKVFKGKKISEFLKTHGVADGRLAEFIDMVNQGYCYAPMNEYEMSFYAPFVFQTLAKGDLRTGAFFGGNNQLFAEILAQKIIEYGGVINLNSAVTAVRSTTVVSKGKTKKFAAIVMASPVNELYKKIITPPPFAYTHFYAAVMKMPRALELNKHKNWSALFVAPKNKGACITSIIRAKHMVKNLPDTYLIINYKVTSERPITATVLAKQLNQELNRIVPGCGVGKLVVAHQWKVTMPVATTQFVKEVRAKQGKNKLYFAGDYLGAPSMETAVSSGVQVASLIKQQFLQK